jgi:hypothetical protein
MNYEHLYAFFPFIILGLFVLALVIPAVIEFFEHRPKALEKLDHPVIAYKRAMLLLPTLGKRAHDFKGVYGSSYGVVDRATSSIGFHAYEDFKRARSHPQAGNVFLEVVMSGDVQEHKLGWTATEQRVLQVIPHCGFSVTGHVCRFRPNKYFTAGGQLYFRCSFHSFTAGVVALSHFAPLEPISGLATRYPSFEEHNVVVAFESGDDRFVATELTTDSEVKS